MFTTLEYGENHLLLLNKKEHRNHLKIKYLKQQIKIVEEWLSQQPNSRKKEMRTKSKFYLH